ncbi:MAG: hypothetical protein ACLVJ6_16820 [Merdibacter sp.]
MERSSGDVLKDKPRDPSAGVRHPVVLGMQGHPDRDRDDHRVRARHGRQRCDGTDHDFAVLCLSRLFHGFNCRSEYSLKHIRLTTTATLSRHSSPVRHCWPSSCSCRSCMLFSVTVLNTQQLLTIVGLAVIPTIIIQITKMIREASAR